jgi:hypothetical protein
LSAVKDALRRRLPIALGIFLALAAFGRNAADAVLDRPITVDEGADLLAAQAVAQGRFPCRDFACTAAPLYPFVAGPPFAATGVGVMGQRVLCAALAFAGLLALAAALAQRTRRAEVGAVAAFSVAASPHWVGAVVAGGSSGAAVMSLCVAAAAAFSTFRPEPRAAVFVAFGALAVGFAPLAAIATVPLAVCLCAGVPASGRRALLTGAAVGLPLAGLLPLVALAPSGAVADLWGAFRAGAAAKTAHGVIVPMFAAAPGAVLALAAGLVGLPALVAARRVPEIAGLAAAALGVAIALALPGEDKATIVPFAPLAAGAGLAAAWALARGGGSPLRHALWLAPLMALYQPIPSSGMGRADAEIAAVAAFMERGVAPGRILTPQPAMAAAAGRLVVRGTELGARAVLAKGKDEDAERLHLTTLRALARVAETRRPRAIVLHRTDDGLDFGRDRGTGARHPAGAVHRFQRAVSERYERKFTTRSWAVYLPRAKVDVGR